MLCISVRQRRGSLQGLGKCWPSGNWVPEKHSDSFSPVRGWHGSHSAMTSLGDRNTLLYPLWGGGPVNRVVLGEGLSCQGGEFEGHIPLALQFSPWWGDAKGTIGEVHKDSLVQEFLAELLTPTATTGKTGNNRNIGKSATSSVNPWYSHFQMQLLKWCYGKVFKTTERFLCKIFYSLQKGKQNIKQCAPFFLKTKIKSNRHPHTHKYIYTEKKALKITYQMLTILVSM